MFKCLQYEIPTWLLFSRIPILLSKKLGKLTAKYRWFAVVYILGMFFLLPGVFVALTFIDPTGIAMYTFLAICAVSILMIVTINYFQSHERYHKMLPLILKNWKFLPEPMRSLAPYDRYLWCKLIQFLLGIDPNQNNLIFEFL